MDLMLQTKETSQWQADVVLIPVFEETQEQLCKHPTIETLAPWLAIAPALRDVCAQEEKLSMVHGHPELALSRMLFMGLGSEKDCTMQRFRNSVAAACKYCQEHGLTTILLPVSLLSTIPLGLLRLIEETVYAAFLSTYDGGLFKSKPQKEAPLKSFTLALDQESKVQLNSADMEIHAARGKVAAEAVLLARTLDNTPANYLSPAMLAKKASDLAQEVGLQCQILDEVAMQKEQMGALLAVGQGSVNPPRLIVLEHAPHPHADEEALILVGKGICFDSGGISLKPAANMHVMKSDMTGAGAVLAAMVAIAKEKLPIHCVGLLACAENLPDGGAVRPGDVVTGLNVTTIEITNTDAEGRLVLCDALAYAQKHFTPKAIVDIATLTGACAVALGDEIAGLFSTDQTFGTLIQAAGQVAGENFWPMPLWENYTKKLKSEIADICHTATREGGAITAALFLKHFVQHPVWAHLDVAGVDWVEKGTALCPTGASGIGARTLLELARGGV